MLRKKNIQSFYCIQRCYHSFYVNKRSPARKLICEPGKIYQFDVSTWENKLWYCIFDNNEGGTSHNEEEFKQHFISLTELRKQKLLKIKGGLDEDRLPTNTNTK